jgi:hypothetical protein
MTGRTKEEGEKLLQKGPEKMREWRKANAKRREEKKQKDKFWKRRGF